MSLKKLVRGAIAASDHRAIGARQKLFFFSEFSKGSCFFLPRGAHIYHKLISYLREEYKQRRYDEIITPNIYSKELMQLSGHWQHYEENMINFQIQDKPHSLKPMNCPGHCLVYQSIGMKCKEHQLPIRLAEFGVLHRNEQSGSMLGLTRGRRFQQDDAHIFCTPEQVEQEVRGCLDLANKVYSDFSFNFDLRLSLRPSKFLGDTRKWDEAEESLRAALRQTGLRWQEQQDEGAFYGPKIDLIVKDKSQREYQCATIQLDFQLPEQFELTYSKGEELGRPVIIHRAILGSIERFIAMLAEHCDGLWPFWLSPMQAVVIPVHSKFNSYAQKVSEELVEAGFWVDCDADTSTRVGGKTSRAVEMPYNLILYVGQEEVKAHSVSCRVEMPQVRYPDSNEKVQREVIRIQMPVNELCEYFRDFEKRRVTRADQELLRVHKS